MYVNDGMVVEAERVEVGASDVKGEIVLAHIRRFVD
jgi:hypothetical protein